MKQIIQATLSAAILFSGSAHVHAQGSNREAAIALVEKAVAYVKENGVEKACKQFADPKGGFMQGDLYVFVQDMQVKMVCHAANPRLNGKDLSQLKDVDGKRFSYEMAELVKSKGAGWVDYQWVNPTTKALEPKSSYVQRVDDKLWLGVGIYRK